LKKKIKLGIEGDLTSYLYDVLPLGPPFKKEKRKESCVVVGQKDISVGSTLVSSLGGS